MIFIYLYKEFIEDVREEYEDLREEHLSMMTDRIYLPIKEARRRKFEIDWQNSRENICPKKPKFLGVRTFLNYSM